jgi:putative Mg2+ transporter-C (MgtC) family protein
MQAPQISGVLQGETRYLGDVAARLGLAAVLGGIIGLEREFKHRPAGLRTNLFICLGSALFTMLSSMLSVGGDHTRIAAQNITGIGFIGAGSILRDRGEHVTGLTTAATIFVAAGVGMAAGGGLYITACIATAIVLVALFVLGKAERRLNVKSMIYGYEVAGFQADEVSAEVNRVLEPKHAIMHNVEVAPTPEHVRVHFELQGTRKDHVEYLSSLQQSSAFRSVSSLGPKEAE